MSKARANADATSQAYIENATATQNLSGTFAGGTERLYFNDLYTLTGNVTIQENAHLALGTIADKDVIITQDGTERTITGEGTLEAGELLSSKETDLTGMTGELGSAVTGSPNLNLRNATEFPSGHVIQVVQTHLTTASSTSLTASTGGVTGYANITDLNCTITPKQSNSNMLVHVRWNGEASTAQSQDSSFGLNRDSTALGNPEASASRRQTLNCISQNYFNADAGNTPDSSQFSFFDTSRSAGTSAITYYATCQMATTCTLYTNRTNNYGDNIWDEIMTSTIIIEEIAG